jgi:OmpA-OmpF porin, OOP family
MKLKMTLLAAAATLAITPAANAYEGLYGAIGAGLNYMQPDRDLSNDGAAGAGPFIFDTSSDYDKGIGVYTALGYDWGNSLRTELEFAYRNNDIRHIAPDPLGFSGWPEGTVSGDMTSRSIMLNVLYDLDYLSGGGVATPYFGGGVGFANINPNILGSNPAGAPTAPLGIAYGDSKSLFAYQGIAGIAFDIAERLVLDVSYRYFATKKGAFTGTLNGAPATFESGYNTHSVFAGLRWNFSAPPAAAVQYKDCWDGSSVPMTSECPPQLVEQADVNLDPVQFTVYFDYDKANLTSQASALVREAAARALENDIETVVVSGNTDTSGSSAYNQALSERRARVVRDALIANHVPADHIRVEAYGEGNPAKPTPDGTREPLNRRTDVVISFM